MPENILYFGDNLKVLREHFKEGTIDLIYLDPPFNSKASYNVLFAEQDGSRSAAQIRAFSDTWRWDQAAVQTYQEVVEEGGDVAEAMRAFQTLMPASNMLAYLSMMAPRLKELHRVLKPTGSIYLHCDPTASHYLKILMDAICGPRQFRNEIIWRRTGSHNSTRRYGPIHDVIMFYTKTDQYYFNRVYRPYLKGHVEAYFKQKDDEGRRYWTNALTGKGRRNGESGLPWRSYNPTAVNRHWAIPGRIVEELGLDDTLTTQQKLDALDEAGFIRHPPQGSSAMPTYVQYLDRSPGMALQDIWAYQPHTRGTLYESEEGIDEDIRWLVAQGDPERLGYETQKPVGLLKRIIHSSCPEGGIVLDPFCGCGTTIDAAHRLGKTCYGIDITYLAIDLIKRRLRDVHKLEVKQHYRLVGDPVNVAEARALAEYDRFQFQWWALSAVDARGIEKKKGADKGIDGRLYFHDEPTGTESKQVILSVKSGAVSVKDIRELNDVVSREKAAIGVLITLEEPTQPMRAEAAQAGTYKSPWREKPFQRTQVLTIADLAGGKGIDMPPRIHTNVTFRTAPKPKARGARQQTMPFEEPVAAHE